jgi:small subunit ribosomal protein S9
LSLKTSVKKAVIITFGKRKKAKAIAQIRNGIGRVRINGVPLEIIQNQIVKWKIMEPLLLVDESIRNSIDIEVKVSGGGFMGQAEAARMAIARGLIKWAEDEALKLNLINYDRTMLAGDPRQAEPKKFGGPGARRRRQKSYR